jgi:hypothetical protein
MIEWEKGFMAKNWGKLKNKVPKFFIWILLLCLMFSVVACDFSVERYETQDLDYYYELKKLHPHGYRFFPDTIDENSLERFSYIRYNWDGQRTDFLLVLQYQDDNAFEEALLSIKEDVYSEYYIVEKDNLFKEGYTSLFMTAARDVELPESYMKWAYLKPYSNGEGIYCSWEMILYSSEEKFIIFNDLYYDTVAGEYGEHTPYIEEVLGVTIKEITPFATTAQEVIAISPRR